MALSMWKLTLGYCNRCSGYLQNEWFPTLCFAYHVILRGECQVNGGLGNKHHVQLWKPLLKVALATGSLSLDTHTLYQLITSTSCSFWFQSCTPSTLLKTIFQPLMSAGQLKLRSKFFFWIIFWVFMSFGIPPVPISFCFVLAKYLHFFQLENMVLTHTTLGFRALCSPTYVYAKEKLFIYMGFTSKRFVSLKLF